MKKACPGTDPPGPGRIRLHSARAVPQGRRWYVAVPQMARQRVRLAADRYTDDRMDFEKATRAAATTCATCIRNSATGTGHCRVQLWTGAVEKAVERTAMPISGTTEPRSSTGRDHQLRSIILAMTIMEKNAAEYGLDGVQLDPPLAFDTVEPRRPPAWRWFPISSIRRPPRWPL